MHVRSGMIVRNGTTRLDHGRSDVRTLAQATAYAPETPDEERISQVLASDEPFECQECHWRAATSIYCECSTVTVR
jgi:hypothetical protein